MTHFRLQSRFANNAVIIVDGLGTNDMQTARRLHEDLEDFALGFEGPETYFRLEKVNSRDDFVSFLRALIPRCEQGLRPILHIECHGDQVKGLAIGDNQEQITWPELYALLSEINAATKNNTGVVMAACFGFHLIWPVAIDRPCPFYFLIGSQGEIPAGVIAAGMKEFYKTLFKGGALEPAMARLDPRFKQFLAEKFFAITWGRHLKRHIIGKGRRLRQEDLITKALSQPNISRTPENLRLLRFLAKQMVEPTQWDFDLFAQRFLHGNPYLEYSSVVGWVKSGSAKS